MRTLALAALAATCLSACEADGLSRAEPRPDVGVPPVTLEESPPESPVVDAGVAAPDATLVMEPPPAKEPVYIHTGDTLFAYDSETNEAVEIGPFVSDDGPLEVDMVDIAIDVEGRMFGGTRGNGPSSPVNDVYQIDPSTGRVAFRFRFEDELNGLTFLPTGELVVAGARVSLVDPNDGTVLEELVEEGGPYETSGDVVALPDGYLYWTVRGERRGRENVSDRVVRVDPNTGAMTVLGDARADRIFGLGYAEGALYGFSSTGLVVVLDPDSGVVQRRENLSGRWFGATTNPVLW